MKKEKFIFENEF